ncbi:unnamed protein product [Brachionus calyciflorus]|uniref:Mitochondrial transcription rescue factor 1 C-terminal domain-containing protein n=1 Tax=Brachionus calyciflorus TaxID=104777 RepID=A0A814D3Y7_9BILA|nr:unnamed protein product [Brachionus calyciflorus]
MNKIFNPKNVRLLVSSNKSFINHYHTKLHQNEILLLSKTSIFKPNLLIPEPNQIRFLSKKHGANNGKNEMAKKEAQNENDDDEYEDVEGDVDDEEFIKTIDTSDFKPGFKIVQKHVPSLRVDSILAAGLNISRKKIDDNFYSSKLRLNGEKVLKKSFSVKENDHVDLIGDLDEKAGRRILKRVYIYKVFDESSKKNKPKVVMVTWKSGLFEEDAYKSIYKN